MDLSRGGNSDGQAVAVVVACFALSATADTPWGPVRITNTHLDTRVGVDEDDFDCLRATFFEFAGLFARSRDQHAASEERQPFEPVQAVAQRDRFRATLSHDLEARL